MIACTIFKDAKALQAHTLELPWPEIRSKFLNPDSFKCKEDAPLFKLATFDGTKTNKGSLRHNAAMMQIYGVEGDYDAEVITIAQAIARLKAANIEAAIYASPSNEAFNPETGGFRGPRWRVIAPLSKPHTPQERKRLVGVLNTALGGILTGESFTQSQAFYFGRVDGALWEAGTNAGLYLDAIQHLEPTYPRGHTVGKKHELKDPRDKQDVIGAFCRAFNIYEAIEEFLPDTFEHIDDNHFTWCGHQVRGVFATDDEQHLGASHDTWPFGTNNVANTFDIVRQFKFDPDMQEDILLPAFERQSYRDMCDWAINLPEVKLEMQGSTDNANAQYFDELEATEWQDAPVHDIQPYRFQPSNEFMGGNADTDWIIKDVIPQANLVVMYGASGSGKSFIALDLVMAVTTGQPWRDKRTTKMRVAYIAAEGSTGFKKRMKAYAKHHGIAPEQMELYVLDAAPNFLDETATKLVSEAIRAVGRVGLVVVDTWSQVMPGANENSSEDMGRALAHCRSIAKATHATVLLIHHSGKDQARGARGWSGLRAAADAELEVVKEGEGRILQVSKMKDGRDDGQWGFDLQVVELYVNSFNETVDSCVVLEIAVPVPQPKKKPPSPLEVLVMAALRDITKSQSGSISIEDVVGDAVTRRTPDDTTPLIGRALTERKKNLRKALIRLAEKAEGVSIDEDGQHVTVVALPDLE
jgi:KaiC/GvpD/RAD55 family RecA-like ATPase